MIYIGAYFGVVEARRMEKILEKEGIKVVKIVKRKGKFPLNLLTVHTVYADKTPWWLKRPRK